MTLQAPMRCSALAEQLDEPMIGTIDERRRWLLLEDRSAWGTDAVKDVFGANAAARAKRIGLRLLLVRRREGPPEADAVRRAILVDTATGEMALREVTDAAFDVDALASTPIGEFGEPLSGPVFLVCTNGKRDACCALRGRALLAALGAGSAGEAWECTHLGGHRFAANLVCLPHGLVYGRVAAADGLRLARLYRDGRVDAASLRGRSAWPPAAQVAEQALRLSGGLAGVDDVRLAGSSLDGDRASVTLATRDGERRFELAAERLAPPRAVSCRADELEEPIHWRVVSDG